ncbi:MAG: transcriptional regulator [Syntrophomonas sp.]|nr:transcriptional regulator [Syntrophomonas sp.]
MLFEPPIMKKSIKELRKNQGLTAKELAARLRIEPQGILSIDNLRLKDIPQPLRSKLLPILRGDYTDKIPWL